MPKGKPPVNNPPVKLAINNNANADFLRRLFPPLAEGEYMWWTHFKGDHKKTGQWGGLSARTFADVRDFHDENTFYSPAILKENGDTPNRDTAHFSRLCVIVLDDVDITVLGELPPTYLIETSSGKYHAGYKLAEPITDIDEAGALVGACTGKRSDKSGNNVVRYVRLPVGQHGSGFKQKIHLFDPSLVYTPAQLLAFFAPNTVDSPPPSGSWQGVQVEIKKLTKVNGKYVDGGRKEFLRRWVMSMAARGDSQDRITELVDEFTSKFDDSWTPDDERATAYGIRTAVRKATREHARKEEEIPVPPTGDVFLKPQRMGAWPAYPWVMQPWFMRGSVTPIVAPGGTGKSALVALLAKCMASGKPVGPVLVDKPVRVCIVTYEDEPEIYFRRLQAVEGVGPKADDNIRVIDGKKLGEDMRLWTEMDRGTVKVTFAADNLGDMFEEHWKPDIVFIDTLSQINGALEDNPTFARLIGEMAQLAKRLDACIVPVHHTGQEVARSAIIDQYSSRGGSAFSDNSRGMLQLVSVTQDVAKKLWPGKVLEVNGGVSCVALVQVKANYSALSAPVLFAKESDGATHSVKLTLMRTDNLPDAPTKEEKREEKLVGDKELVCTWLRRAGPIAVRSAIRLKPEEKPIKGDLKLVLDALVEDGLVEMVDIKRGGQPTKAYKVAE